MLSSSNCTDLSSSCTSNGPGLQTRRCSNFTRIKSFPWSWKTRPWWRFSPERKHCLMRTRRQDHRHTLSFYNFFWYLNFPPFLPGCVHRGPGADPRALPACPLDLLPLLLLWRKRLQDRPANNPTFQKFLPIQVGDWTDRNLPRWNEDVPRCAEKQETQG